MSDSDMPVLEDHDDLPGIIDNTPAARLTNGLHTGNNHSNFNCDGEDSDDFEDDYEGLDDKDDTEDFIGSQNYQCLLCPHTVQNHSNVLVHMTTEHQFDFIELCFTNQVDQISYVKLVNYVRKNINSFQDELKNGTLNVAKLSDEYMMPIVRDDAFLIFDMEDHLESVKAKGTYKLPATKENNGPVETLAEIDAEREELRTLVRKQRTMLNRLASDMIEKSEFKKEEMVGMRAIEDDAGYFDSYSNYEIHHEMLSDKVRTKAYQQAILQNTELVSGSRVLDLGCGTSILSMFCADAKAASVRAIDMASIAFDAMEIVRTNRYGDIIQVIQGRLEDQHFPEKFDIIVSEWMGYFLLFEGMLDSVIYARDRFLAPGGTMMPNRCTMHLLAIDDKEMYSQYSEFWSNVYGYDMSCIAKKWLETASTITVRESSVATSTAEIAEFDINKCSTADTKFTSNFSLTALRDTKLVAFAGYFDTHFDLPHPVSFSTGPLSKTTHWKQTVFLFPKPLTVKEGDVMSGTISVHRHPKDVRALEVKFKLPQGTLSYSVE